MFFIGDIIPRLILPFLLAILSGCASFEAQQHYIALSNFTYTPDPVVSEELSHRVNWSRHNPLKPFSGDCEDYAFSLQSLIGGKVYQVQLDSGQSHAVLVKDGIVYDSLDLRPINKADYPGLFLTLMVLPYDTH